MPNDIWGRIRGGLANALSKGTVYNRYTGEWAPASVTAPRLASGLAALVGGPAASVGTGIWKNQNDKTYAAGQFDAGLNLSQWQQANRRPDPNQLDIDVPDVDSAPMGGGYSPNIPTLPPVVSTAPQTAPSGPWAGLGTQTGNAFQGGQLGNWINGTTAGGQGGPRAYGQAAGSFTPWGAGVIDVAGSGWAGTDAAAGFGLGAQGAGGSSGGGYAISDAQRANRKNRV